MLVTNGNNVQLQPDDLHVQEVIRSAERELRELLERRAELMKRIGTIKQTFQGWRIFSAIPCLAKNCLPFSIARLPAANPVSPEHVA